MKEIIVNNQQIIRISVFHWCVTSKFEFVINTYVNNKQMTLSSQGVVKTEI